ncbi:organic solvent tolerance protein [Pelagibacterales bacterium SAG-MED10]|nr:organic solvent tolerance protein [Pelagibacterales bacterium SAG-MED10]
MKSKIYKFIFLLFFSLNISNVNSQEQFSFDVTQIDILENGNLFIGTKRGTIISNNGIIINADQFEYQKKLNILNANGNVKIIDHINNFEIYSDNITYEKNDNFIFTDKNSKAFDLRNNFEISANRFEYNITKNIIIAKNNSVIENKTENYKISSNQITYFANKNKIFSTGKTTADIFSKYRLISEDVTYLGNLRQLSSGEKTIVKDKFNLYNLEKFSYQIDKEILKGQNLLINTNYNLPTSDKFYFKSAIINLKDQSFLGNDAVIKVKKDIFDDLNNDPRIIGVSASGNKDETKISKGIFTSCKENENCTPWSIQAKEIIHDKNKKEIIYNNALLKIYDFPILYFPKFFHPDPTVNRRSGFLKPQINNSNILGNSFSIPYYTVVSQNKDFTFTPSIFENNLQMFQNEFRQINKNSKLYANFGFVNNYETTSENKKNSILNLFSEYELDLNFEKFSSSNLLVSIERVTKDTFLKIFDTHIQNSILKPEDYDNLKNEIKISLNSDNQLFTSGLISYENLQKTNSDRYEFILPYYNYSSKLKYNPFDGEINFTSYGKNVLSNTNQLKSNVINDIIYNSKDFISSNGIKSSFVINTKNLNSLGKNNKEYKSSPQIELMNEIKLDVSYPLLKQTKNNINHLIPKAMMKINPSDMKNYSSMDITTNVSNIFNNNRLGVVDTLEAGRSLTLGLNYKKETLQDLNKFFEFKVATVLRDKEENFIPNKTTLNKKNSNLFGSISNNFSDYFNLKYNFAVNNNLDTVEYNNLSAEFNLNNLTTKFDFLEERNVMGDNNFIENNTSYTINNQNYITFKTRRNRKLNLTEYYDLVYQYKNDCLSAGIKYKKTYYEDRDLKPSENLFFTISLIPLTNYEQKIER